MKEHDYDYTALIAEAKTLKNGDWIFTCAMKPKQFDKWLPLNPDNYNRDADGWTDESWEQFINWDTFCTIEGGHHSAKHCSLTPITAEYAKWYLDNKMYELATTLYFEKDGDKEMAEYAEAAGLKYEGM